MNMITLQTAKKATAAAANHTQAYDTGWSPVGVLHEAPHCYSYLLKINALKASEQEKSKKVKKALAKHLFYPTLLARQRPLRLAVRTHPFHGCDTGSSPVGVAISLEMVLKAKDIAF